MAPVWPVRSGAGCNQKALKKRISQDCVTSPLNSIDHQCPDNHPSETSHLVCMLISPFDRLSNSLFIFAFSCSQLLLFYSLCLAVWWSIQPCWCPCHWLLTRRCCSCEMCAQQWTQHSKSFSWQSCLILVHRAPAVIHGLVSPAVGYMNKFGMLKIIRLYHIIGDSPRMTD